MGLGRGRARMEVPGREPHTPARSRPAQRPVGKLVLMQSPSANFAAGLKCAKKGFCKKPDWETAVTYFQEAGKGYVAQQEFEEAVKAYSLAADAALKAQLELPAATNYREAANSCERLANKARVAGDAQGEEKWAGECKVYHTKVAKYMAVSGKFPEAAREYLLASRFAQANKSEFEELVQQAFSIFEQEKKPVQAGKALVELIERMGRVGAGLDEVTRCLDLIEKCRGLYRGMEGYDHKIDQVSLFGTILCLSIGDTVAAENEFLKFANYRSDAAMLAEDLLNAFKSRDPEALEQAKHSTGGRLALTNDMILVLDALSLASPAAGAVIAQAAGSSEAGERSLHPDYTPAASGPSPAAASAGGEEGEKGQEGPDSAPGPVPPVIEDADAYAYL